MKDDPKTTLARAVAKASAPPEPPGWVQKWQMLLAAICLVGAIGFAFVLLLKGPPAPKTPDGAGNGSDTNAASGQEAGTGAGVATAAFVADPAPGGDDDGAASGSTGTSGSTPSDAEDDDGESTEDEPETVTADSLANLNDQAPWAFAIVALLVGAFIATGKTLNFGGGGGSRE